MLRPSRLHVLVVSGVFLFYLVLRDPVCNNQRRSLESKEKDEGCLVLSARSDRIQKCCAFRYNIGDYS